MVTLTEHGARHGDSTDRDLRTARTQVFGDVECGTQCRVCGRNVTDGRSKTCSDYCDNLLTSVMGMLNWTSVRRLVIDRDDKTCQRCGFDYSKEVLARRHIRARIEELAGEQPDYPGLSENREIDDFDWDEYHDRFDEWRERKEELKDRYGNPYEKARSLEVDHVTRIADGGHPFDPGNLQTLCDQCHHEKTAEENAGEQTPSRGEMSESLFDYVSAGGAE